MIRMVHTRSAVLILAALFLVPAQMSAEFRRIELKIAGMD
jgi:hypothetical protein